MSDFDLTQLKLKTSEDLDGAEKDYIIQHQNELNEEDKAAYSDFLPREEINSESEITEDKSEEVKEPVEEKPPEPVFKSQEDVDKYLEEKLAERDAKQKEELSARAEEEKQPEQPVFFQDGEKPTDWNDALTRAYNKAKEDAVLEYKKMNEAEKEAFKEQQKKLDDANKKIQEDFEKLVKENKIPELDSEEGKEAQRKIIQFGIKHRKNVLDAFELLEDIPTDRGGFLSAEAKSQVDAKAKLDAQKKLAGKVGGGNKGGEKSDTKPKLSPEEYARMDVQDIIEWGLEHR